MSNKTDGLVESVNFEPSLSFVVYHNKESENYPKHWHSAVEIVMPVRNPYSVSIHDESYRLNEYDIIIIPSGDLHELSAVTELGERLILQFDLSVFKATEDYLNPQHIFLKPSLITPEINPDLHSELKKILLDILEESEKKVSCYEASVIVKILSFAVEIAKKQKFEAAQDPELYIRKKEHITAFNKCIDYIGQHYKENLTLDNISNIAGFSKYYFWRWFQQYSSMTFKAYLDQIRIKAAENLLMDLNVPITDVALESGFQSIATFNRVFKSMNKCTPTEYREYNRGTGKHENVVKSTPSVFENAVEAHENNDETNAVISSMPPCPVSAPFPHGLISEPQADFSAPDIISANGAYYMVNAMREFLPGCPIMRSYDLINWEPVCYVLDILTPREQDGRILTPASIKSHKGKFYTSFASSALGKTFIFTSENIESTVWERHEINRVYENISLLFSDEKAYIVHGTDSLIITEFDTDGLAETENGVNRKIADGNICGVRSYRRDGKNYITFLNLDSKKVLCCRFDSADGEFESFTVPGFSSPVSFIDTPDEKCFAVTNEYSNALKIYPVKWTGSLPFIDKAEKAILTPSDRGGGFVSSDEFYQSGRICVSYNNTEVYKELASKAGYLNDLKNLSVEILENTSFENGLNSWTARESANISIKNHDINKDRYMLYVSGRRTTSSGPLQVIGGKVNSGEKFKVSAAVKYTTGPKQHTFNISISNSKERGDIHVMASSVVEKGEWCLIEGTYTIPANSEDAENCIFIETARNDAPIKDDLMSFCVGSVSMVKKLSPTTCTALEGQYDLNGSNLSPFWQWHRNPDNNYWSLTERSSFLRLYTCVICNTLAKAVNTLTQRSFGPVCSGTTALETEGMKNGDVSGLAALEENYAHIAVKMYNNQKFISVTNSYGAGEQSVFDVPCLKPRVYFRLDFDFSEKHRMCFYYSYNLADWFIAADFPLSRADNYGYRFALFNYAQEFCGGYVDFDFFRVDDSLLKSGNPPSILEARLVAPAEVTGVPGTEFDFIIEAGALKNRTMGDLYSSLYIPEPLEVTRVTFDRENVEGDCSYSFENNRLELKITGNTSFINRNSNTLAAVRLRVGKYVKENTAIGIKLDYIHITGCNAVYKINRLESVIKLNYANLKSTAKHPGCSNPLIDHKYGADPFALVYDGRVYIYLTSDAHEYDESGKVTTNTYSKITSITVISSADLVNWTDHGEIPVAGSNGVAKWANHSWAPSAAYKKINGADKFFLYFANDASNIGVLTADSPVGPWTDPLGTSLINRSIKGVEGVTWCFDPAVLVDDDGAAYLYFGGGLPSESEQDILHPKTGRVIKLGNDMISVSGDALLIDAPALFEDSGIHKYKGKYYYSYCSNFEGVHPEGYPPHGEIAYMVSDNPMTGFKYVGPILKNPEHFFGVGGNNHHAIFEFNGRWYITYHAQTLGKAIGDVKGYRSPHINAIEFYEGGNIKEITADMEGVAPVASFDPYKQTDAVTYAWSSGISTATAQTGEGAKLVLSEIHNGDWLAIASADFGDKGAASFIANIKSLDGGVIEIHLDSHDGEIIGILRANAKEKSWNVKSCEIKNVTGVHDIFMLFKGNDATLFSLDYWKFL